MLTKQFIGHETTSQLKYNRWGKKTYISFKIYNSSYFVCI